MMKGPSFLPDSVLGHIFFAKQHLFISLLCCVCEMFILTLLSFLIKLPFLVTLDMLKDMQQQTTV